MKKCAVLAMTLCLVLSLACPSLAAGAADGRETVVFWQNYTNVDEAAVVYAIVDMYNESQDKYFVEVLSSGDTQKVITAIANNEAPDIYQTSSQNIISFQANGLLASLNSFVEAEGYDLEAYSSKAIEANTIDENLYALPLGINIIQLFYNIDLLEAHGYDGPPETMEALYEMAMAITTLDDSGNIDILGYPLFPFASARQELIYAFGGRWWAEDGKTLTPTSQGVLDSLNMNVSFREAFGIDTVQAFIATANTNRYTEQDMFFAGKQLFRLDGPWLATMAEEYGSEVNFGVTLVPGTEEHPENRGASRFETTSVCIPVNAPNMEGAWDFLKFYTNSEGTKQLLIQLGNLPALKSLWEDPDILALPVFDSFIDALREENGILYPKISDFAKYNSLIEEHLDYVYNGMMSPEDAMNMLNEQAQYLN